jgi:hypothetical protein
MTLVAPFELSSLNVFHKTKIQATHQNLFDDVSLVKDFLSQDEVDFLISEMTFKKQIPVGVTGKVNETKEGDSIRSYRLTTLNMDLANILWNRIQSFIDYRKNPYRRFESNLWKPVGINPSFRYIRYADNGLLVPHYDFPYEENENKMTLMSLVMYLTTNKDGATDFVHEYRENDDSDWTRMANKEEIYYTNSPKRGEALLFPHNILHQGNLLTTPKTIIRTDIMFEKV